MQIRVATYNVHKCAGLDGKVSPLRIGTVIRQVEPDVIGLQEVLQDQAEWLARHLQMELALGTVREHDGKPYGNAVLSRFPVENPCVHDITVEGREPRGCLRVEVKLPDGQELHLFNLHLGTAFFERQWQARRLFTSEIISSKDLPGPRVVVGDFNEWTRGLASIMLAAELKGTDIRQHLGRTRTYPGILPILHLDHIYYDEDLEVQKVKLHRTATALLASDHLPLVADFAVLPPTGPGERRRGGRTQTADGVSPAPSGTPHTEPAGAVPTSP